MRPHIVGLLFSFSATKLHSAQSRAGYHPRVAAFCTAAHAMRAAAAIILKRLLTVCTATDLFTSMLKQRVLRLHAKLTHFSLQRCPDICTADSVLSAPPLLGAAHILYAVCRKPNRLCAQCNKFRDSSAAVTEFVFGERQFVGASPRSSAAIASAKRGRYSFSATSSSSSAPLAS